MPDPNVARSREASPVDLRPRGTLVIIVLFGLFFALTWLATYLLVFLRRGTPQP
jgi:hypothetical protein